MKASPRPKPDPFPTLRLVTSIQEAGPIAAHLLARGFDDDINADLVGELQTFAGDDAAIELVDENRDMRRLIHWIEQAYCVGVAVGQRLQPGAFDRGRGGAR